MPPKVATVVFAVLIVSLFALDRDRDSTPSKGLWLAVVWLFINGSRPVSQWLSIFGFAGATVIIDSPEKYIDGSPVDRFATTCLLVVALIIEGSRYRRAGPLLRKNAPILLFLGYCATSVLWSDYTFVAFKRWTKIVGDLLIVLLVLTDPRPVTALRRLLSRTVFLLVPISVLFIKYYPELGREYNRWTYIPSYTGVAETKNELGMLCLVFGLGSVWCFLRAYREHKSGGRTKQMAAHGLTIVMALWLFYMSNSMTSMACFTLASVLVTLAYLTKLGRKVAVVHFLVASFVLVSAAVLFSGGGGGVLSSMGRDPTLTGRTDIWKAVLSVSGNPLIGTGFESFWMGERLLKIWGMTMDGLQEAHNGYLEVYLNLGWFGVSLLLILIITGYRNVITEFRRDRSSGSIKLAFFSIAIIYNLTEAGFRENSLTWTFFLMAVSFAPQTIALEAEPAAAAVIESADPHHEFHPASSFCSPQEGI